eukprot:CAMPEP_0115022488 /NCGR_PEP_ID=MMETSP0216-20121206/31590_1 /TAXON_ID=223996 /ORGANISM="Protocruzia adherens, Strain Boccale" /LENGTH=658 /DNA_ID=CAMNT_0002395201 /DNA_START=192 /DNA_END=2168 /DNA_ORIENTATION=+
MTPGGQVFAAAGQSVRGYTRKGRDFFKFDSNLTEIIRGLGIRDTWLWATGDYMLNAFEQQQTKILDKYFYASDDIINDMVIDSITGTHVFNPILACQDKHIRVLHDENLMYSFNAEGPVSAVKSSAARKVLYGTDNGAFGLTNMLREEPRKLWSIVPEERAGGITCINSVDFTQDGNNEVVLTRDDGNLEIHTFDPKLNELVRQAEENVNESVTSLESGIFHIPDTVEVLLSTYTGRVIAMTNDGIQNPLETQQEKKAKEAANTTVASATSASNKAKASKMKEIKAVQKEIEAWEDKEFKIKTTVNSEFKSDMIAVNSYKLTSKFAIIPEDAAYILTLECQHPIEVVALQGSISIDLLDMDSNTAIMNRSPVDQQNSNFLLATYRCSANVNRIEIKMRTTEGEAGELNIFVIPFADPKTTRHLSLPIKPLSLHQRTYDLNEEGIPLSELRVAGNFSKQDAHGWLAATLPDIPPKVSETDETSMQFKSTYVGSVLFITYQRGMAVFRSDSVSTIMIIKDIISQDSTNKKVHLDISSTINDHSADRILDLLHPKFEYHHKLHQQFQLIEGLKEIQLQENDISFMEEGFKEVLDKAAQIKTEFEAQPRKLHFLYGIITDLYIDRAKFKGWHNYNPRVPMIHRILANYNIEDLKAFFGQPVE